MSPSALDNADAGLAGRDDVTTRARHVAEADSVPDVAVEFRGATRRFGAGGSSGRSSGGSAGGTLALDGIDLEVRRGEFVCLLGASGCGKSTMLNIAADLDKPTTGTVDVHGRTALMFQEHALMPWLTAVDNVALPMRLAGVPKAERRERAEQYLDAVHLQGIADRRPHELSGGMRQRVAIARTLATGAPILLMDEPFAALDAMTRDLLHDELESLFLSRGLTVLFVTHNVREAVRLGDRVVLLSSRPGRVVRDDRIDLPRPRRGEDDGVAEITADITRALKEEVARHAK